MEEKLLGHLLKANDPETTREVEQRLADDPVAIHDLAVLKRAFTPLDATRDEIDPPSSLWLRAIGRVAEHVVATEGYTSAKESRSDELIRRASAMANPTSSRNTIRPAPPASDLADTSPRRRNVVAVVGLTAALLALMFPAIVHVRERSQQAACQNSMRQFYAAVSDYSSTNEGQFPRVEDGQPASTAAQALRNSGYLPMDQHIACPAAQTSVPAGFVDYAYSLGFREPSGRLHGLDNRPEFAKVPILADAPLRIGSTAKPCNHRHGQNVLYAGGNVAFCTTNTVGVNGDDIFCNVKGQVGAGLFPMDSSLGRANEEP